MSVNSFHAVFNIETSLHFPSSKSACVHRTSILLSRLVVAAVQTRRFAVATERLVAAKAETHKAPNRCDTLRRQVASSALLLRQGCLRLPCRCDMSRDIDFHHVHMSHEAIGCSNLSRERVAAICHIVCLGLEGNLYLYLYLLMLIDICI